MIPRYAAIWLSTDCRSYRPHHKQRCWAAFFRSMNRKIPHALDEHEGNTLGFDEVLIPGARQQVVDQGGDVADVDAAVLVAIGGCQINA